MFLYINGKIIPKEEASISPFDHGFLYGIGLFETFRVYNGHPFLLDDHLDRLNSGLKQLNIDQEYSKRFIEDALDQLLEKNGYDNAYIRLNVSAGIGEIGLKTDAYIEPNLIIFSKPLPPAGDMGEKKAVVLETRRNTPEGQERLKSHHYLNNIFAKREIGSAIDLEGIFLTKQGYLAEGIVSNLFWIKDDILYTPHVDTGILNGITRQFVMKLAKRQGLEVHEGFYGLKDVEEADEMFVTNSIQEIVPISLFQGRELPGENGAKTLRLQRDYRKYSSSIWTKDELI